MTLSMIYNIYVIAWVKLQNVNSTANVYLVVIVKV